MKVGIEIAEKIVANPRGGEVEGLTFQKKYVIILKKDIFTPPRAGPLQEQR
jgi:hypothetical protein